MHAYTQLGSTMSMDFEEMFRKNMKDKLAARPDIAQRCEDCLFASLPVHTTEVMVRAVVIPGFPVSCRRLTPGPGYLEALCSDHVCSCRRMIRDASETYNVLGRFRLVPHQEVHSDGYRDRRWEAQRTRPCVLCYRYD